MRKPIQISMERFKRLSALGNTSPGGLIEKAPAKYLESAEEEEKEDAALLSMMLEVDTSDRVDKKDFLEALEAR